MNAPAKKPKAAFGTAERNVPGVVSRAKAMYAAIFTAIVLFPAPPVAAAAFLAMIDALGAAQAAITAQTKGLRAVRDVKLDDLWTAMWSLRTYVQALANALSHDDAVSLIEAAGLLVAGVAHPAKPVLQARLTTTPGLVELLANARILLGGKGRTKRTLFMWQISADGGQNWTSLPSTPYASTEVGGLKLMTEYRFRVAVVIAKTQGDWSQEIKILLH